VKTGGRLIKHARYYWLLLAGSHLTRRLFGQMLRRIWALPMPSGYDSDCGYKIRSRTRKVGIVSEKSITRQQADLVRRRKRAVGAWLISLGPAPFTNSCVEGKRRITMRETEVQIGDSG
jgi:hypothetical protein